MGRILAVDYGERRVGLAFSDESALVASGSLETIDRRALPTGETLEQRLAALAREHGVSEVVVGLPLNMDGSAGESAQRVLEFVARLEELTRLRVATWDERLTTVAAQRAHLELALPLKARRDKGRLDRTAAIILLQNYLSYRAGGQHRAQEPED